MNLQQGMSTRAASRSATAHDPAQLSEDEWNDCDVEGKVREEDDSYITGDTTRMRSASPPVQRLSYTNTSYKPPAPSHLPQPNDAFHSAGEVLVESESSLQELMQVPIV